MNSLLCLQQCVRLTRLFNPSYGPTLTRAACIGASDSCRQLSTTNVLTRHRFIVGSGKESVKKLRGSDFDQSANEVVNIDALSQAEEQTEVVT